MYSIETFITTDYETNTYLFWCQETMKGIVIDPGDGAKMILDRIQSLELEITMIVLTHGHSDHLEAVEELRKALQIPVVMHEADQKIIDGPMFRVLADNPAEILISKEQDLTVGNMVIKVLHTPGHTPGGICLYTDNVLFSGDTLFRNSVGATHFLGGNMEHLLTSIREKILVLPDVTKVYPGHGESTSIGYEKKNNPFLNGLFKL